MKRIGSVLIALLLVFSCTACGNRQQTEENVMEPSSKQTEGSMSESDETASSGQTENHGNTADDIENTTGKTLVVYYSATGTTKKIAGYISAAADGDLFEIVPAKIYTDEDLDWTDQDSRVCREHDNESERNVELAAVAVDNWNEYDTVFIGFPIWWGIAAWPVNGFVEGNDFTGKRVIPFCTSGGSGLGENGDLLENLAGTGTWLEGGEFRSSTAEEDIQIWIESLGL